MPEGCQLLSKIFFNLEILTVYIVNEIFCKAEIKLRIFSSAYHFGGIVTVVVVHIHAQIVFAYRRYALRRQKRLDGIIVPFLTVWAHTLDYLPRLFGSYPILLSLRGNTLFLCTPPADGPLPCTSNRRAHRYPFHGPDGRCLLFRNREDLPVTDMREEVQKRGQTDEESSSSVILCRKTRMRIKRQPGLRRIQSRKSGKAEGENGHSISILPAFLSSWLQT